MAKISTLFVLALTFATSGAMAQSTEAGGPYRVLKTARVGGDGGFDYVYADSAARRLYIARGLFNPGKDIPRITVFDLDTLAPVGTIPNVGAHGVAVDPKSNHGFVTSKPVVMFDSRTLAPVKTIDVQGNPDGLLGDPSNQRVYIFSHTAPNVTVINAADGTVAGTIDLGGMPEQGITDGNGHLFVDLEDKGSIAVVDTKTLAVTARYDLAGKGGTCTGLALDVKNHVLFASCRDPQTMVILSSENGKIIATFPIGRGTDGAVFNPVTMEAFSSQTDGTLTVVKENSPADFVLEQTVQTKPGAKTITLDSKTGHVVLMAADYDAPATPPPAGRRGGQGPMVPGSFSILVVGR